MMLISIPEFSNIESNPIAIIMVGPPGSGKTTFLKNRFGIEVYYKHAISTDHIIETKAAATGQTYDEVFSKTINFAKKCMDKKLVDLTMKNELLLWDQTNLSKKKRKYILSKIPKQYETHVYCFNLKNDIIDERLLKRNKTGKTIPKELLTNMRDSFTIPNAAEGFDNVYTFEK